MSIQAMILGVIVAVSATPFIHPAIHVPDRPPVPAFTELLSRIEHTLGPAAVDCGQFYIKQLGHAAASAKDLRRAITCVKQNAANRTPAFVIVQLQGIDSSIAYGLLAHADGSLSFYTYDDDPSGGSGAEPSFDLKACAAPKVAQTRGGSPDIRCEPSKSM